VTNADEQRDELGARKWNILRAIVWDYVETAEPVGSGTLVQRYHLGVGPATIRHEMAEMLEWGYLLQPHTSAGRVPSDVGYRYYVNRIPSTPVPSSEARSRLRAIQRAADDIELLMEETCRLLARLSEYAAIAATESNDSVTVRQAQLLPVGSNRVLLVLVLSQGHVENRLLEFDRRLSPSDVQRASEHLNLIASGTSLREISRRGVAARARVAPTDESEGLSPAALVLFDAATRELRSVARRLSHRKTLHGGIVNLLAQPEFERDVRALHEVLSLLDDEARLNEILESLGPSDAAIVIGSESGSGPMAGCSLVASRFYAGTAEAGTIGLLGPTRMRYEQAISLVRYTARLLSETLTRLLET
jgi:heat-inducible transcriptional repressor